MKKIPGPKGKFFPRSCQKEYRWWLKKNIGPCRLDICISKSGVAGHILDKENATISFRKLVRLLPL